LDTPAATPATALAHEPLAPAPLKAPPPPLHADELAEVLPPAEEEEVLLK
jgi:hypothetical protein